MRGKSRNSKIHHLREKCKQRRKQCERLKKRNKELSQSRDSWCAKAKERNKEIWRLRKKLDRLALKQVKAADPDRVKRHSYGVKQIELALLMLQLAGLSYRACCKILKVINLMYNLQMKVPSYSTIRYWEHKLGYYRLAYQDSQDHSQWALLIDESVSIGQEKLLLLLGVNLAHYSFDRALCFEDVRVLDMAIGKSWKAEQIATRIEQVQSKGYDIAYAVGDQGHNIVKALKIRALNQVKDCTHLFSLYLEKAYKTHEDFKAFCQACTQMRRKGILSQYAALLPPAQRAKARFLNLSPLINWGCKCLDLLQNKNHCSELSPLIEHLEWIENYREILVELKAILEDLQGMQKMIKTAGFNCGTFIQCLQLIGQSSMSPGFKQGLIDYLNDIRTMHPQRANVLCCSDIIESYFGKYKLKAGQRISQQCLQIPNYARKQNSKEVKLALEQVRVVDLNNWVEKQLGQSTRKLRMKLFKKIA